MKIKNILTVAVMSALVLASCKNGKSISPIKKALKAQDSMFVDYKTRLADSVLVRVDSLAELYIDACTRCGLSFDNILTANEKLVKPDYLYDPAQAASLITKPQKTAVLAVLLSERPVRQAYGMPVDETDKAISKLLVELNYPMSLDDFENLPYSDVIRKVYYECRNRNELCYFWEFQLDALAEITYLMVNNMNLYSRWMTDDILAAHVSAWRYTAYSMRTLAQFDKEMARILAELEHDRIIVQKDVDNLTVSSHLSILAERKQKFIDRRNRMVR